MNEDANQSTMSKKAAITGMGITSVAASSDLNTQLVIAGITLIAVISQAVLDWRAQK